MRTPILIASLISSSSCVQDAIVDDPESDQDGIVNGILDPGHLSVGLVYQAGFGCTGTLIGPHTVLTAAHCLAHAPDALFDDGVTLHWGAAIPHPSYGGGADFNYDIGILSLYSTSTVAPTPISIGPTTPGQPLTMVGFGYSSPDASDFGTKRYAHNVVAAVDGFAYTVPGSGSQSAVCFGDSGGPDFYATGECQIGVHSRTAYPYCANYSITNRVDVHAGWILGTAGDGIATCLAGCNGVSVSGPGFPSSGAGLTSVSASGSALIICGYTPCGDSTCPSCSTLSLGGVTVEGPAFQGRLQSIQGLGSSLQLCGWVESCAESCYGQVECASWTVSGASVSGGLNASLITGITPQGGSAIELTGYITCGGGENETTCPTSGTLVLTCAP